MFEEDFDFPTVYFIGIMDFAMHPGADRVDFRYALREQHSGELMTPRIQYIFLELPNSLDKGLRPEATVLENICYALHQMEHLTEQPAELKQEIFKLLFDSAEIATFTPEEKSKYEHDMTTERDRHNQLVFAEAKGVEKGLEKGRAEGLAEGLAEGRAEGLEQGAREKALETARALIALGVSQDIVVKSTGLSVEEVEALREG